MRSTLALAALVALSACGGSDTTTGNAAAPTAQVQGKAPPAGQQWTDVVTRTPEGGWRIGNPNAPLKLVEFGSRTCHVCREFDEVGFTPLTTKYVSTGRVSYEFRDFLRNGADLSAALVGGCGGTGPFFTILNQMYAAQPGVLDTLQKLPQNFYDSIASLPSAQQPARFAEAAGYLDFVKQRGIPEAQARACLADAKASDVLVKMNEKANQDYQIAGTPTFVLNGKMLENTVNWQQVENALRNAGG